MIFFSIHGLKCCLLGSVFSKEFMIVLWKTNMVFYFFLLCFTKFLEWEKWLVWWIILGMKVLEIFIGMMGVQNMRERERGRNLLVHEQQFNMTLKECKMMSTKACIQAHSKMKLFIYISYTKPKCTIPWKMYLILSCNWL